MKLLHTSDWHLGMSLGTGSYEADQRHFFSQLYNIIRQEQIDAVLLAGDVYDNSVSNAAAIALYNEAVTTICMELSVPMIVIAGNHDSAARLASCRSLLRKAGLYVSGKLERDPEPILLDKGRTAVYPLPFFNKDEVLSLYPEETDGIHTQEQAAEFICSRIRQAMDPGRCNIVLSHALVVGSELSDSDRSARIGLATAISKDVFREFDYTALGHIHKPQVITDQIVYSGSPIKYSFGGEETQEKGVVIYDTETGSRRFLPITQLHDRVTVTGTFEEIFSRTDLADSYLRLQVTDRYAGLELWAELQSLFPLLLELKGKSLEENDTITALSVEELHSLDETDILRRFLAENFSTEPTSDQMELFRDVLTWSQEEVDLG